MRLGAAAGRASRTTENGKETGLRKSKTLTRIRAGQPARICSLGHFVPPYIGQAAAFGYDCVWLDLEHRAMTDREVQALLAYAHRFDIDVMVRPPSLEKSRLYRYLEDGATGLMIPMVSTVDQARMLVDATRFSPLGGRGLEGTGLDNDFQLPGEDYTEAANRETFLVVQIETLEAVERVDEIAAVEGVDGLFFGPGDLGLRIQQSDTSWTLETAQERVANVALEHGKPWGRPVATGEQARRLYAQGARLIVYGNDFMALMETLKVCSRELEEVYGSD